MLGAFRVVGEEASITRFRTRRVGLLLAYLACFRNRVHYRDEIGELLWPETDPEVIRRNLRQALSSLRHVVEPPPLPPGSILQVQQSRVRLNPDLVETDIGEFDRTMSESRKRSSPAEQASLLRRAVDLYRGDLLPGFDEDWIVQERLRLEDLYVAALRRLIELGPQVGTADEATAYLRQALEKERLNEDLHVELMRRYLDSGRPASALQQFEDLRRQLDQMGEQPGSKALSLWERAKVAAEAGTEALPEVPLAPLENLEDEQESPQVIRIPVVVNRFCGRQEELQFAVDHLVHRQARLTTLLGPAGTGKTRLSIEVGRHVAEREDWNVWFVPLADISDGAMLMDAVLDVVRARGNAGQDPHERLRGALLGPRTNLLILDNLEHIVDAAAPVIAAVLEKVHGVRLLVTTRQLLKLSSEHQIPVPPLPIPDSSPQAVAEADELAALAEYPSIQLFVDRCQTVRPDFQLTPNNANAVATICAKLEGVPLAIELAAGLSGSFPPSQMVFHLQKRLTALTSRRRDMPARHRSLRAAIDYSYETLPPPLQRFFAALSVFRGGFKVDAAYEVCYLGRVDQPSEDSSVRHGAHDSCLDLILELQERSLLRAEGAEEECELCFRMFESFREYAEEHLSEAEQDALRARHADYYRSHPRTSAYSLSGEERARQHLWIDSEYENYLAALDHFVGGQRYEPAIEVLAILSTTWSNRGPREAERNFIRRIADRLESSDINPAKHILLLRMLGTTYIRSLEYSAAHRACRQALAIAERQGLREQIPVCYTAIATCAGYLGRLDECLELSEKVLQIVPEDNVLQRERAYLGIGAVHWGRGEMEKAEEAFLAAAELSARRLGGEPDTLLMYNLARVRLDTGRLDDAMTILGDGMRISRRVHDDFGLATCLSLVSRYHWLRGNFAAAIATGYEALLKYRNANFTHYSLMGIFQQALILSDLGEFEAAATLLAATNGIGRNARLPDERDHRKALEKIQAQIPSAVFERAWARGLAMDTEEAFRLALRFK